MNESPPTKNSWIEKYESCSTDEEKLDWATNYFSSLHSHIVFQTYSSNSLLPRSRVLRNVSYIIQNIRDGLDHLNPICINLGAPTEAKKIVGKRAWKLFCAQNIEKNSKFVLLVLGFMWNSYDESVFSRFCLKYFDFLLYVTEGNDTRNISFPIVSSYYSYRNLPKTGAACLSLEVTDLFQDRLLEDRPFSFDWSPRRVREEHQKDINEKLAKKIESASTEPLIKGREGILLSEINYGEIKATLLNSEKALLEESLEMHHCVYGYGDRVKTYGSKIYSIRGPYPDQRATLEITPHRRSVIGKITPVTVGYDICQLKGKYNAQIKNLEVTFLAQIIVNKWESPNKYISPTPLELKGLCR